ncbi:RiPP maturation radical SAM protein 1 [Sphingomonas sp. ABOLE]|uniref:RiPP maturation radical SAM C-methyltransferase n=1 Tax=Sphingomonas sp. ABOLE TaxID=1985878 RepID=UPI000F7EA000|nr:RiPP maturation radical SAM C-methyltransferase [Sphingomonas sp. ABOLE]RSV38782.1 RiPP maturation radical SAM protein 1 [Sphingomonas sp. ABOLE]
MRQGGAASARAPAVPFLGGGLEAEGAGIAGGGQVGRKDVCLVSMPYPVIDQPSVALGLLQSALEHRGIATRSWFPCLWFAEEIGLDVFSFIADSKQEFLVGEWTFAGAAFPEFAPDQEAYLDTVLSAAVSRGLLLRSGFRDDPRSALLRARAAAPDFVDRAARQILSVRPRIVGCTSTFFQHCASLALLRRIRALDPSVITVMGGANCEGAMGVATRRCFPWVDFVVSGEADTLFPELCARLLAEGRDLPAEALADGVVGAANIDRVGTGAAAPRASVRDMNDVPAPNFDDYFAALEASPLRPYIDPGLAVETSRGCWWGAKKHCTFCGLNGGNMAFRSKAPERVLGELRHLSERHQIRKFNVVDNILDMKYFRTLLPQLAEEEPYRLFFETKANLRRDHLELIAAAGIRRLQPGIETMHDEILRLIDKGTTALQNVQLLKWARELGIFITWNFLWDVPGECDGWYGEMADWLPRVAHLQPPGIDRIQFHRFSPYHQRAADFGLTLAPYPSYESVYPVAAADLKELAYYFDAVGRPPAARMLAERPQLKRVVRIVGSWKQAWDREDPADRPALLVQPDGADLVAADTRPGAPAAGYRLTGLAARLYAACDGIISLAQLMTLLASDSLPVDEAMVRELLADLVRRELLLEQNGRYLALALRQLAPIPDGPADFPGGTTNLRAWYEDHAALEEVLA